MSQDQLNSLARIFTFEKKLREAQSIVELRYIVTNELRSISPYIYSFFGTWTKPKRFKIEAISDIAVVEKTSPVTNLVQKIIQQKYLIPDVVLPPAKTLKNKKLVLLFIVLYH